MPTTHELKIWPEFFEPVLQGLKTFEMRGTMDRTFEVGDTLVLNEYNPHAPTATGYTGRVISKAISHVLRDVDAPNMVPAGYAFLSFARDPVDMLIFCPACGLQHVDAPEDLPMAMPGSAAEGSAGWTDPTHRSHLCRPQDGGCGHIWRHADVATNGVASIATKGKHDSPIVLPTKRQPRIPDGVYIVEKRKDTSEMTHISDYYLMSDGIVRALSPEELIACTPPAATVVCKGKNCGTTTGDHSTECIAEHEAATGAIPTRSALIDLIEERLHAVYHCTREWSAWQVNTMTEDDFTEARGTDLAPDIADAVLSLVATQAGALQALEKIAALDARSPWAGRIARGALKGIEVSAPSAAPAAEVVADSVLRDVCARFLACIGPNGYFPQAGKPLTDELRAALAAPGAALDAREQAGALTDVQISDISTGFVSTYKRNGHTFHDFNALPFARAVIKAALACSVTDHLTTKHGAEPTVEQVEDELSMGHGSWDMEDPKEIIRAVLRLSALTSATAEVERQRTGGYLNYTLRANDGDTRIGGFDISAEQFNAIAAILESAPAEPPAAAGAAQAVAMIAKDAKQFADALENDGWLPFHPSDTKALVEVLRSIATPAAAAPQQETIIDLAGHKFELRDLLQRAMRNLHKPRRKQQRWVIVRNTFGVGSTVANALCRAFELDPDEYLEEGL